MYCLLVHVYLGDLYRGSWVGTNDMSKASYSVIWDLACVFMAYQELLLGWSLLAVPYSRVSDRPTPGTLEFLVSGSSVEIELPSLDGRDGIDETSSISGNLP